jgi:hypothetical protein
VFVPDSSDPGRQGIPPEVELGPGEAAAISLAAQRYCGVLIDEKLGRAVAAALGLPVIGTIGVLLIAHKHGLIASLRSVLEELNASGYYLSPALVQQALRQAGEA